MFTRLALANMTVVRNSKDLSSLYVFMYMHNNHCHRVTAHFQLNILLLL